MATKSQVHAILNKKMNRQDFLKHVAVGVVALTGVGSALRVLSSDNKQQPTLTAAQGYGTSAYGGSREKSLL